MKKLTVLLAALLCAGPVFAQNYYTGSAGGKGTLIAIKVPEGKGLSKDEEYLLTLVQSVLLEDFTRFSDMAVIDRQKLTQLLEETESGLYSENSDTVRAGELESPRYILSGTLTKTSSFLLSLSITDTKKSMSSKATYTENVSRDELDDFSAINKAAEKLLNQMGIKLTAAGKVQMYHVTGDDIDAGLTLARGLSAAGNGGIINVAEQNYLYRAQNYDQTRAVAKDALKQLDPRTKTGDVGVDIMNEFQKQEAWEKTLNSYSDFYSEHPPFDFYYSVPDGNITNYKEKKYKVTFSAGLRWNQDSIKAMEQVLEDINKNLKATKKKDTWGFGWFPNKAPVFTNEFTYDIQADLVNGKGEIITSVNFKLKGRLYLYNGKISAACDQVLSVDTGELIYKNNIDLTGLTIRITYINDTDAESAGRDGIVKIVRVERDKWPIEQSKPKWIAAEEKKQKEEKQKLAMEKQKTEKELEKQIQKEQKKQALEDSVFNKFVSMFVSGGPYLGPSAGSINLGMEVGWGILNVEGSLFFPLGLTVPAYLGDYEYDKSAFVGVSFGAGLAFYGEKWLLVGGGGIEFIYGWLWEKNDSFSSSYYSSSSWSKDLGWMTVPYIQARFDLACYLQVQYALTFRIGYRLDFYPADKYDLYFDKSKEKFLGSKMVDNLFFGFALILR